MHSIVLAINNPSQSEVDAVVGMHIGGGWRSVWCADHASLSQLPPPDHGICYLVAGVNGSLTLGDIKPYIHRDWRDVAVWGPGKQAFSKW